MNCEHPFCTSDQCYAKDVVGHDSLHAGRSAPGGDPDSHGKYWSEEVWGGRTRAIQKMADSKNCVDPQAVQETIVAETAAKRSRGELS